MSFVLPSIIFFIIMHLLNIYSNEVMIFYLIMQISAWKIFRLGLVFILLFIGCHIHSSQNQIFTYQVQKNKFMNKITIYGEVEAKQSYSITCPEIWPQPKIKYLVDEGEFVKKGEVVCLLDAAQIENDYQNALSELEESKVEYNKTKADIALRRAILESQVKSVDAAVSIARLQLPRMAYVSPVKKRIIELEIERSEVEKSKINKKLIALDRIQASDLKRMQMKIKQAENKLNRAQMFLDRLTLRATADGVVVYAINWITDEKVKAGDMIWGGMPIVQIPVIANLQVKATVDETNIKRIQKDQPAEIRIDAIPASKISGKVSKVASVGKPIKRNSKIKNFEVIISMDSTEYDVHPGLTTTCEVIIEAIADTIAIPLECVFQKDSLSMVYCRHGSQFKRQEITPANKSNNFVLISKGLAGNEELALSKPPEHLVID